MQSAAELGRSMVKEAAKVDKLWSAGKLSADAVKRLFPQGAKQRLFGTMQNLAKQNIVPGSQQYGAQMRKVVRQGFGAQKKQPTMLQRILSIRSDLAKMQQGQPGMMVG